MTNRPRRRLTRRERRLQNERADVPGATATTEPASSSTPGNAPTTATPRPAPAARATTQPSRAATARPTPAPRREAPVAAPALGKDIRRTLVVLGIVIAILAVLYFVLRRG